LKPSTKPVSIIQAQAASIFVHVSDLRTSAEWYGKLLGLPLAEERFNGGPVYWFDLPHTDLILDDNSGNRAKPGWREEMKPRIMFKTPDIDRAYAFAKETGEPFFEPEHYGTMSFFNFRDPEGQAQMICWTAHEGSGEKPVGESPIEARIASAFVDVQDMPRMARWYADLLGIPEDGYVAEGEIVTLPVARGGSILLDANRHLNGDGFTIPFMFATDDLEASLRYAKDNGFELFGEPEYYGPVSFFVLKDPDGNLVMVCRDESVRSGEEENAGEGESPALSANALGINGVSVFVRDLKAASEWYAQALGFEIGPHDYGDYCELQRDGKYVLHLLRAEEADVPLRRPAFSFDTRDIEAAHRSLFARGATVFPLREYGDHRAFEFEDPEGNRLSFCRFER